VRSLGGLGEQDHREHGHHLIGDERAPPGEAFKQHAPEREHVYRRGESALAAGLLRRHVRGCPHDTTGAGDRVRELPPSRKAEIEDRDALDLAAAEEQVARLEIAVDDAALVGDGERRSGVAQQGQTVGQAQRAAREALRQVFAGEPLHGEVGLAIAGHAMREVLDDPWMAELAKQLGLAREPLGGLGIVGGLEELDRDRPVGAGVDRAVDGAHPARARSLLEDEALGGGKGRAGGHDRSAL